MSGRKGVVLWRWEGRWVEGDVETSMRGRLGREIKVVGGGRLDEQKNRTEEER